MADGRIFVRISRESESFSAGVQSGEKREPVQTYTARCSSRPSENRSLGLTDSVQKDSCEVQPVVLTINLMDFVKVSG